MRVKFRAGGGGYLSYSTESNNKLISVTLELQNS